LATSRGVLRSLSRRQVFKDRQVFKRWVGSIAGPCPGSGSTG